MMTMPSALVVADGAGGGAVAGTAVGTAVLVPATAVGTALGGGGGVGVPEQPIAKTRQTRVKKNKKCAGGRIIETSRQIRADSDRISKTGRF
jgi:hypothetical protein